MRPIQPSDYRIYTAEKPQEIERETCWKFSLDVHEGYVVSQNELATSKGQLVTNGLYTCAALGIEEEVNFLAHVDAGSNPSFLAHWIDKIYLGSGRNIAIKLFNYHNPNPGLGILQYSSRVIDQALEIVKCPYTLKDMGSVGIFDQVVIGGTQGKDANIVCSFSTGKVKRFIDPKEILQQNL
jgi:hypothetical protein